MAKAVAGFFIARVFADIEVPQPEGPSTRQRLVSCASSFSLTCRDENKALNEALTWESMMNSKAAVQAPAVPAIADEADPVRNLIDQTTANLIARVNAVSVTVEDVCLAAAEIQKLPIETCNREARTRCLAPMFKGRSGKAFVVNSRLEAMAQLIRTGKIPRCWVLPNMVRNAVFLAAATEPILFTASNESFFESESFLAFLLETAEVDGCA